MFNPSLTALQFLLLTTALAALIGGYWLHARLLPWLLRTYRTRPRYFVPHPYRPAQTGADASADEPTDPAS